MTYVYLNPEGLQSLIDGIKSYANLVYDEMLGVSNANIFYSSSNGVAPAELSGFVSRLGSRGADLKDQASYLQTRLDAARASNECGVSPMTMDGKISYYLPDDQSDTPEAVSAANHVDEWRQAKSDAEQFKKASLDGDEDTMTALLNGSMANNECSQTYAITFASTMGADYMLDAPLRVQGERMDPTANREIISTMEDRFGNLLATASQGYKDEDSRVSLHSYNLRDDIYDAITQKEHSGRVTVLDAYMTSAGAADPYQKQFLIDLADKMEDVTDFPDQPPGVYCDDRGFMHYSDPGNKYLVDEAGRPYSMDPLSAPLGAMAYNPEAAVDYFAAPNYSKSEDYAPTANVTARGDLLENRKWSGESLEGLSAAYAAASSRRYPDLNDPNPRLKTEQRATWATAQGINLLAAHNDIATNSETRRNIGVLLGNCGGEMEMIAENNSTTSINEDNPERKVRVPALTPSNPDGTTTPASKQMATDMRKLVRNAVQDDDALTAIGQGTMKYAIADANAGAMSQSSVEDKQEYIGTAFDKETNLIHWLDTQNPRSSSSDGAAVAGAKATAGLLGLVPGGTVPSTFASAGLEFAEVKSKDGADKLAVDPNALAIAQADVAARNGALDVDPDIQPWYRVSPYNEQRGMVDVSTEGKKDAFRSWLSGLPDRDGIFWTTMVKNTRQTS
ncbi:hypothetical protein CHIBA101_2285 [Actinomyces sp. Chiba101]|uniref:DUF6571 family protein n=1 Tax=Actinomyces TaxID=1654 RepID=UPI000974EC36|nr:MULTISPECIES: DUF6571 family protein [Actinomyces]BAW94106.1 hypothetical protein CHIBA101_2285 [Actinomyces sp. Chiba101]GAV95335.1 hypothetical protein ADENT20671_2119 [Actinomyces denticolens]SUU13847.1 Uncharacterised protein [Actinomyces denticolens]